MPREGAALNRQTCHGGYILALGSSLHWFTKSNLKNVALLFIKYLGLAVTHLFSTSDKLGTYDFLSSIIQIKRYRRNAKAELELALSTPTSEEWSDYWPVRTNFASLFVHEATHFTDCTTTTWGLEFNYRKFLLMNAVSSQKEYIQPLSVFMLNAAELHSHEELIKQGKISLTSATSMTHTVEINSSLGPIINIHYNLNGKPFQSVPLSLLSVLEANAYSNEVLYKILACEKLNDCEQKFEYRNKIESDFYELLSDNAQSEYTLLINLVKIHSPYLTLKELLVYVSVLCRFTLDLNDMGCSVVSNYIERTIGQKAAGSTISHDLRRAGSRAVIFFKTALGIHQWINEAEFEDGARIKKLLANNPLIAISQFWEAKADSFKIVKGFADSFMFDHVLDKIISLSGAIGVEIFSESSRINRAQLNNKPLAMIGFRDLKLFDILLEDDTVISVPNRIDLDVEEYFELNCESICATESIWDKAPVRKFFVELDGPMRF